MPVMCFINQVLVMLCSGSIKFQRSVHTERESFSKWCYVEPLYEHVKWFSAAFVRSSWK